MKIIDASLLEKRQALIKLGCSDEQVEFAFKSYDKIIPLIQLYVKDGYVEEFLFVLRKLHGYPVSHKDLLHS